MKKPEDQNEGHGRFRRQVNAGLKQKVAEAQTVAGVSEIGDADTLRIDLHCHDHNSDVPDETLGRLLRLPETWLPTAELGKVLRGHGTDVLTVTNHNNARSCWDWLEQGEDVLPAAEFSVTFPDVDIGVHVLTFGITQADEEALNSRRKDAYRFLEYTAERDLPTSLAHPLHFYSPKGMPSQALMDRFALCFERFEGVNGQRDAWQNLLTMEWVQSLTPEALDAMGRRIGIRPDAFCRDPYRKQVTGGSDCHFGIFSGSTGTALRAPGWRQDPRKPSQIALEALRRGEFAPYGAYCGEEKLMAAFLEFFCNAALRMQDPGLLRLLLHRGDPGEKLLGYVVANGFMELKRHRMTSRFLGILCEGFRGKKPGLLASLMVSKPYRPMLQGIEAIAKARQGSGENMAATLREVLPDLFTQIWGLLCRRVSNKVEKHEKSGADWPSTSELLARVELPVHFRALVGGAPSSSRDMTGGDLGDWMDGLPFPFLASVVLGGSAFAASTVLHDKRPFVDAFAESLGKWKHPHRALWLSDTFFDRNGVSHVLQATLAEARERGLPLDFLACDEAFGKPRPEDGSHLKRLPVASAFSLPFYREQPIRLPDVMAVHRAFAEGGYDRVVCSTEAPMGLLALYLREAFHVPAYFYLHTDWLDFAKRTLGLDKPKLDRLRRFLRAFYRRFDGVFVLNTEQRDFLISPAMGLDPARVHLTAHWVDSLYRPAVLNKGEVFAGVSENQKVLLFAGRLSFEKGLRDLPQILAKVRALVPEAVLAVAGTGPAEAWLREALPDTVFLGWQDKPGLARAYAAADLLVLPSWFDTFSCALLEGLSCGLPAVAYATKGPADLILDGVNGYLARDVDHMGDLCADYLAHPERAATFRRAAAERGANFEAEPILQNLLTAMGLQGESVAGATLRAARPTPMEKPDAEEGLLADLFSLVRA